MGLFFNDAKIFRNGAFFFYFTQGQLGQAQDSGQGVFYLMGDPGAQLPEGRHFLGLNQRRLGAFKCFFARIQLRRHFIKGLGQIINLIPR